MRVLKGLTLVEVMIVIGIVAILLSITGFYTTRTQNAVSIDTTVSSLINDIKSQQINAMSKFSPHGVYFESGKYVLFYNPVYDPANSNNFSIPLENGNEFFAINLPSNQIVFSSSSGEIDNFDADYNSFTLKNSNEQKTIRLNKLGTVYEIN